jgi:hypothetical protein
MSKKKDFTVSLKLSESNALPVLAELISSTLKMEAIYSSETSVETQGAKRRHSRRRDCLPVLAELISSTLKMEGICSSETSVETQRAKRRHFPEDVTACRIWLNLFLPP